MTRSRYSSTLHSQMTAAKLFGCCFALLFVAFDLFCFALTWTLRIQTQLTALHPLSSLPTAGYGVFRCIRVPTITALSVYGKCESASVVWCLNSSLGFTFYLMTQTFLLLIFSVSFWNSNHICIRIANIFLQLEFVLLPSAPPPPFHLLFALVWIIGDFKFTTWFSYNKLPNTTFEEILAYSFLYSNLVHF